MSLHAIRCLLFGSIQEHQGSLQHQITRTSAGQSGKITHIRNTARGEEGRGGGGEGEGKGRRNNKNKEKKGGK